MSTTPAEAASDSVLRRLKKLLTLAADPAATPGEAENAMRMAQNLMAKYGVSDKELAQSEVGEFMFKSTKAVTPPVWESDLMWALAAAFGAKLLWYAGRGVRGARDKGHFVVLAPKHNLEMMKYGFEILRAQLVKQRAAYVAQLPRYLTRPEKAREADTFGVGFVQRLRAKISAYRGDERMEAALEERHRYLMYGEMTQEQIEALKQLREKRKQKEFKLGSTAALHAGYDAGAEAHLNRGVA